MFKTGVHNCVIGPKNKSMFHISVTWFIFNLQRRKILIAKKNIFTSYTMNY
jgi:hypothetical protein